MREEDLRSAQDYSAGQKEAAHRVLVEIVGLLGIYKEDIRIIGGWVPDLLFPHQEHIGSVDVDLLINHEKVQEAGYMTIQRILVKNGYRKHPSKYFTFVKDILVDAISYPVDLDILAGKYNGTDESKRSQRVQGIRALKATGGNYAFDFPPTKVMIESKRPDGAIDTATVNVVAVAPYLVMKTAALGRGKPKDAYDIYFTIKHFPSGIEALAKEFSVVKGKHLVADMIEKLSGKFASIAHSGPQDVADFLDESDKDLVMFNKRDSFEQINALMDMIR